MSKPTSAERARFLAACIIANNITEAGRRCPKRWRVTWIGHPDNSNTGHYEDRAKCERALASFRRTGRAWLQESPDTGRTWRTLDV